MATRRGTAGKDTLSGTAGVDTLLGYAGNDFLNGMAGNDCLDGGTGDDTLQGGAGNDTYVVDSVLDRIAEKSGEGTDLVRSSVSWSLGANLENLQLTGTQPSNGTGNALHNLLLGNGANNLLCGAAGDDTLRGYSGADSLLGGTGADSLNGGADNDSMGGGDGNDTLAGDAGDDVLAGGKGSDTVSYADASSGVTVTLGAPDNPVVPPAAELSLLYTFDDGTTANFRNPGLGASTVPAGVANYDPVWSVGTGAIVQKNVNSTGGDNLALGSEAGWKTGNHFELGFTVQTGYALDLTAIGFYEQGSGANKGMGPNAWRVQVNGQTLASGSATPGAGGLVHSSENAGSGTFSLGADENLTGSVVVRFAAVGGENDNGASWRIDNVLLKGSVRQLPAIGNGGSTGGGGEDTLTGIEDLIGSRYQDSLTGNVANNRLNGMAGDDTLSGLEGDDTLLGGSGNDSLLGGLGNDVLGGGAGADSLTGGAGFDDFRFDMAPSTADADVVSDFDGAGAAVGDRVLLDLRVFTAFTAAGALPANVFETNPAGAATAAEARLVYSVNNGALFYDADGNASAFEARLVVTLTGGPALDPSDFLLV